MAEYEISQTRGLDFCQSAQSGNPTILAWVALQGACETRACEGEHFCTSWERRFKAPPHAVEERPLSPGAVWRNRMGAPVTPLCG